MIWQRLGCRCRIGSSTEHRWDRWRQRGHDQGCNAVQIDDDWADIDYFFAQVSVEDGLVDFKPTCGNILSGVGRRRLNWAFILRKRAKPKSKFAR